MIVVSVQRLAKTLRITLFKANGTLYADKMTGTKLEILLVEEEVEELSEKGEGRERNSHTLHVASRLRCESPSRSRKGKKRMHISPSQVGTMVTYGDSQQHAHLAGRRDRISAAPCSSAPSTR